MKIKSNLIAPPGSQNCFWRPFVVAGWLASLALAGRDVRAADVTWTGGVGNGPGISWLQGTNWSTLAVPGSSDNAVFNGLGLTNVSEINMSDNGGMQPVGSITFTASQGTTWTIRNSGAATNSGILVLNGVGGTLLANDSTGAEMTFQTNLSGVSYPLGLGLAASGAIYAVGVGTPFPVNSSDPGRIQIYSVISDVGGSRSITLTGPGNVYLRGVNTYSGDTVVQNGALELDDVGTPGNGAGTIYLSGGSIQSGASRNGYNTGTFIANPIVLTADAYIFNSSSTANSTRYIPFSGSLGGSAGTLTIANPTSVAANIFCPRFSGAFTFNQPLVIGDTAGDAFNDGPGDFSVVDLCNAATNGAQTWNGLISGPGSVRRSSPILDHAVPGGTAILTGNNTYSGGTTISDGTLFANNTAGSALGSGAVTVTSYGTLAGNGAVLAPVTNSLGGTIQPGPTSTTVGNLSVTNLTFGPGGNYTWQISSVTGIAATAWDLVTCSSGWTDAGGSSSKNVIHLLSLGTPTGWNNATAYTWLILSNNPAVNPGFNASNWAVDTTDFGGVAAGAFSVSTDANGSLDLVYTPIPNTQPVAHMLLLTPGENAALGSAPGKTGTPSAQHSTVGYSVTVEALDAGYHLCSNSIDTVAVTSSAGGDTLPAKAPLVNGIITFPVVNNTVGSTTLTATNVTEGSAVTTSSSTVPVNINGTTTTLTSSANPAGVGVPITFTATVSSGAATTTGTVTFMKNGTNVLGTVPVSVSGATLSLSGGASTNSITAVYSGDANNNGSTSSALSQVIQPGAGGVVVAGPAALLQDGQDYPLATSTPAGANARGPWDCAGSSTGTGSTAYIKIVAGDLSGATIPDIRPLPNQTTTPPTNPPATLELEGAGTNPRWYYRSMSNSVASGSAYFSFLLKVTTNPTFTNEFLGTMIASTANNNPDPSDPLTLHARAGGNSAQFDLGIERLGGPIAWTGDLADNTTYLIVLKYTFGPAAACSLYVNPTPGSTEPAPTASATSENTSQPANIGTVLFYRCGSNPPGNSGLTSGYYNYDVMRADNNWATVTPSINGGLLGPDNLGFSPASQSLPVNQNSTLITVTLLQTNTPFNATADTVVALGSTSGGGTFLSGADGTTVISSVTISNGTSAAAFYYKDSMAGNPTITGASGLLTPATQSETVTGPSAPPDFTSGGVGRLSSGNILLVGTGALGTPYRLWATTNLALKPVTNTWALLNSGTITAIPFTNYDLTATNFARRFYLFTTP